jgi:magnesium chelatase subunit I
VLLSGERGTAKSTAARAFSVMAAGKLPVTLPINATEDRVIYGWSVEDLMQGTAKRRQGLLVDAKDGLLYIDEVNLLDDHIVNIILDVSSTGVLVVQREGIAMDPIDLRFTLVATMNPEEGTLRTQLLDRFGLAVDVRALDSIDDRKAALSNVVTFDRARAGNAADADKVAQARAKDLSLRATLAAARGRTHALSVEPILELCVKVARDFSAKGQRAEQMLALAARANAAYRAAPQIDPSDVRDVARMVLWHRRGTPPAPWSTDDDARLAALTG